MKNLYFYLFLPAVASVSLRGGAVPVSGPLAGRGRTPQLRGEEVHLAEGLGDLQSGEGVVSRRSGRLLFHHPGNELLTLGDLRGSVGVRQGRLGCGGGLGPVCRVLLVPPGFIPDECTVVDVQVPQVLLRQCGVLDSFCVFRFVSGLWVPLMVLWRRGGRGGWSLGWEELVGGVAVGGMKVIGGSVLDQNGWDIDLRLVGPSTDPPLVS